MGYGVKKMSKMNYHQYCLRFLSRLLSGVLDCYLQILAAIFLVSSTLLACSFFAYLEIAFFVLFLLFRAFSYISCKFSYNSSALTVPALD